MVKRNNFTWLKPIVWYKSINLLISIAISGKFDILFQSETIHKELFTKKNMDSFVLKECNWALPCKSNQNEAQSGICKDEDVMAKE